MSFSHRYTIKKLPPAFGSGAGPKYNSGDPKAEVARKKKVKEIEQERLSKIKMSPGEYEAYLNSFKSEKKLMNGAANGNPTWVHDSYYDVDKRVKAETVGNGHVPPRKKFWPKRLFFCCC